MPLTAFVRATVLDGHGGHPIEQGTVLVEGGRFLAVGSAARAEQGATPADTLSRLEAEVTSVKHPPGPADSWLGETIVHAQDIRRPLGIRHHYRLGQ